MFFFFQAEDGIRDSSVTGVQTCALPISIDRHAGHSGRLVHDIEVAVHRAQCRTAPVGLIDAAKRIADPPEVRKSSSCYSAAEPQLRNRIERDDVRRSGFRIFLALIASPP